METMSEEVHLSSIFLEFLEVTIHNILYSRRIYPDGIFTLKKKYNAPVHVSLYPELNDYITECLGVLKHLMVLDELKQLDLCFFDGMTRPVERVSLVFNKLPTDWSIKTTMDSSDPYLTKLHEAFRGCCLKLSVSGAYLEVLPPATSFKIQIHTTENSSLLLAEDPVFQSFPLVEAERREVMFEKSSVLPVRTVETEHFNVQIYIEENQH